MKERAIKIACIEAQLYVALAEARHLYDVWRTAEHLVDKYNCSSLSEVPANGDIFEILNNTYLGRKTTEDEDKDIDVYRAMGRYLLGIMIAPGEMKNRRVEATFDDLADRLSMILYALEIPLYAGAYLINEALRNDMNSLLVDEQ